MAGLYLLGPPVQVADALGQGLQLRLQKAVLLEVVLRGLQMFPCVLCLQFGLEEKYLYELM